MSNIDTPIDHITIDDEQMGDLGGAIAKRLAEQGISPAAASVPADVSTPSTDSTSDGSGDANQGAPAASQTDADIAAAVSAAAATAGEGAAGTDRAGSAEVEGGGAGDDPASLPSTFRVTIDGQELDLTGEQIARMHALQTWATSLKPELSQAMAAVENGNAVAIPVDQFRQYQAWMQQQQAQQQQRQQPATPDLSDLDDAQVAYIRQLEADRAFLAQQAQQLAQQQQQPNPFQQQQLQAGIDQRALVFAQTSEAWGKARGLSETQVAALADVAVQNNMFAALAEAEREYHPINGSLIRDADMASVTEKALNFALVNDPGLYTQVASAPQTATQRAAIEAQANTAVSQKKARAGSLAAAPSQAQPMVPQDVTKLRPDQLKAGMSKMISDLEGLPMHE